MSGHKTYLVRYYHDEAEWLLELKANDLEDAKARLTRLPYATIDGELVAKIPESFGLLVRIGTMLRNWMRPVLERKT